MLALRFGAGIDSVGAGFGDSLRWPVNCKFQDLMNIYKSFLNYRNSTSNLYSYMFISLLKL